MINVMIGHVGKMRADMGCGQQKSEQQWEDSGQFSVYLSCCCALILWLLPLPYGGKLLFKGLRVSL